MTNACFKCKFFNCFYPQKSCDTCLQIGNGEDDNYIYDPDDGIIWGKFNKEA